MIIKQIAIKVKALFLSDFSTQFQYSTQPQFSTKVQYLTQVLKDWFHFGEDFLFSYLQLS
jgi:hypothetical protein